VDGKPAVAHFLNKHAHRFNAAERSWLEAQARTHLSVWEVQDLVAGQRMTVRDLITGVVHEVVEKAATRTLARRDCILARIVESEVGPLMCGCYPRSLGPSQAQIVIDSMRKHLRLKVRDKPDALLTVAAEPAWVSLWESMLRELDHAQTHRQVVNHDGHALVFTTDHFTLVDIAPEELEARLTKLLWATPAEDGERKGERIIHFVRPARGGRDALDSTVYGRARITPKELRIETNSVARADILRARVEGICGSHLRHRLRDHQDPTSAALPPPSAGSPQAAPPPELLAQIRAHLATTMIAWLDGPVPALNGKTPREAARTKGGRAKLELLFRDMEHAAARMPEGMGFDAAFLRAQLGLAP